MDRMHHKAFLEKLIDGFVPAEMKGDLHTLKRARMFVISHMFGPFLGMPIPIFLWFIDPSPVPQVPILAASILGFWAFLLLIKLFPRHYTALSLLSILNLNFSVLWGSYHYGGTSSPFLMWYMLTPMLAFFYLGSGRRAQLLIFGQIVLGLGTFCAAFLLAKNGFPVHVPISQMEFAGILSAFCSTTYAFTMAAYYARVVDSKSELMIEISRHEQTLKMLTMSKEELENANGELQHSKMLAEARNAELVLAKDRLEFNALHDALTGLPNRRYLDDILSHHADYSGKHGASIGILHIDLDRFKQINDTLGHVAGDAMLVHAANLLRRTIRKEDFVARVGGDEFVVVCKFKTNTDRLAVLAERIIAQICEPVPYEGHVCRFGACIGIAVESGGAINPEQLLINSDIALYRAKGRGRNRAEFFSEELQAQIIEGKKVADDILRGLEQNEFVAYYQPQFDAQNLEIVGVEALVRWLHPSQGTLTPADFLSVAEDLNVVGALDRLMLDQAMADLRRWDTLALGIPKVSVNVSARRLNDRELIESLRQLPIQRGRLSFELVESTFLDELDDVVGRNIEQIKALGIDIEIDDFGTGHASIVSLLKLNPLRLKIDKQFVIPMIDSPEHRRLVASIIEIGKSLGIQVVAEGVESMEHARLLRDLGCDMLQGFAFGLPMPARSLEAFVHARRPLVAC